MNPEAPIEYFRKHSALADWLKAVQPVERDAILAEDSTRSSRLELLSSMMGLPIVGVTAFSGNEVENHAESFDHFVATASGRYAVRAFPPSESGKVLRNRNLPVTQLVDWLEHQGVDLDGYSIEFSEHLPNHWASIFAVRPTGVLGEMVRGSLRQLTQGGPAAASAVSFNYDFHNWSFDDAAPEWRRIAEHALEYTKVTDPGVRTALSERLDCEFTEDGHLCGYFETIVTPQQEIRFIDYNVALGNQIGDSYIELTKKNSESTPVRNEIRGRTASRGSATGRSRLLIFDASEAMDIDDGDIIVCVEPTPDMVPLLSRAGALVADRGGVLSHASIVCRELGIPCVVGTATATEMIADRSVITVDADNATVRLAAA
ncbi:PEP-utilizing enzyme [Actinoplanes sp. NPDC049316]|uniref:PEP-utilizing enzyme n=1 Tax=Actinoplanes sp. NPDC049316 TaxID=3154727 RepID=UPI0034274ADF